MSRYATRPKHEQSNKHLQEGNRPKMKDSKDMEKTFEMDKKTNSSTSKSESENKYHKVMTEYRRGTLKDSHGNRVTNQKQAEAIAYGENKKTRDLSAKTHSEDDKKEESKELKRGEKVETEHKKTIDYIKNHPKISDKEAEQRIAKDHLKEDDKYYDKLSKQEKTKPTTEGTELTLYGKNDQQTYHNKFVPIAKNLQKKKANGTYDHDKAVKAFEYEADYASARYAKEHANGGSGKDMFDKKARRQYAEDRTEYFETEYEAGNRWEK